ncbi:MAG: HD domain-containing protein [Candidatus Thorarchaeota archaeon]
MEVIIISIITKKEALELIKNSSKFQHLLRVSKLMKKLANYLHEDENEWELVGLLHDFDYDITFTNPGLHGVVGAEMLSDKLSHSALNAIKAHDYRSIYEPEDLVAKILISADAFDIYLSLMVKNNIPLTKNNLITNLENWHFEKPWLKELIENCKMNNIPLEKFIEFGLAALMD